MLKIDRSFISDITVDQADRGQINAAIAMAHGLNLKVMAEGVETDGQLKYLEQQGCDYAQGSLFSKPISADELTACLPPMCVRYSVTDRLVDKEDNRR